VCLSTCSRRSLRKFPRPPFPYHITVYSMTSLLCSARQHTMHVIQGGSAPAEPGFALPVERAAAQQRDGTRPHGRAGRRGLLRRHLCAKAGAWLAGVPPPPCYLSVCLDVIFLVPGTRDNHANLCSPWKRRLSWSLSDSARHSQRHLRLFLLREECVKCGGAAHAVWGSTEGPPPRPGQVFKPTHPSHVKPTCA